MAYKDLGNNIQFDPETGQIKIVDQTGASAYEYDPRHGDKGGTLYNGQWMSGELDPRILGQLTEDQLKTSGDKFQTSDTLGLDMTDPKIANAFGNNLGDYTNEQNNYMNQWSSLAGGRTVQDAYNTALGTGESQGDPFSMAIQNLAKQQGIMTEQQTKNAGIQATIDQGNQTAASYKSTHPGVSDDVAAVMSNPNMSDAVKQAVLGKDYVGTQASTASMPNPLATGNGQTFDYSLGRYQNDNAPKSAAQVGYVPGPDTVKTSAVAPVATPDVQQTQQQPDTSAETPAAQPDYSGFLNALYYPRQPYMSGNSQPASTAKDPNASAAFSIGDTSSTPRSNAMSTQSASPDFSSGGYNPQSSYSSPSTGASGKGSSSTSQSSSNQGMATGQFGSK